MSLSNLEDSQVQDKENDMPSETVVVKSISKAVSEGFFYYFGYGSNLLKERIHVQIKEAVFESTGVLSCHELTFYDSSRRWFGAIASIEPKPISKVWGCIWKVPNSFADELDLQESGYHRLDVNVQVQGPNGIQTEILCRTYQYSNPERKQLPPSPHYKHVIVKGALEHSLPEEYIKELMVIQDNGYKGRVELDLNVLRELNRQHEMNEENPMGA